MGSTASGSGRDQSALRSSWLLRTVAAFFLGAGVYAGLALAGEVVAHADQTATSTAQSEPAPTGDPDPADPAATNQAAAPAAAPGADGASVASSTTPGDAGTTATTTTTTDSAQTTATDPGTPAGTQTHTVTTSTTSDAPGAAKVTTTATTKTATETTASGTTSPAPSGDAAQAAPAPTATAGPVGPAAAVAPSQGTACKAVGITAAGASQAAGSASRNRSVTVAAAPVPTYRPVASSPVTPADSEPAEVTATSGATPVGAPLNAQDAPQLPVPSAAAAMAGCGGPGAGQTSPKGASAPTTAGVLGSTLEIFLAPTDAAPSATAPGSPTLSATDPGTRPD